MPPIFIPLDIILTSSMPVHHPSWDGPRQRRLTSGPIGPAPRVPTARDGRTGQPLSPSTRSDSVKRKDAQAVYSRRMEIGVARLALACLRRGEH